MSNIAQIMAECDCQHTQCETLGYCMAARIEELKAERAKFEAGWMEAERQRRAFLENIRIKQQCRHCGYQSMDWLGENAACPMINCHGGMKTLPASGRN